jgi:hypothetical protein
MQIENLLVGITIGKGNEYSNVYITIMLCLVRGPLRVSLPAKYTGNGLPAFEGIKNGLFANQLKLQKCTFTYRKFFLSSLLKIQDGGTRRTTHYCTTFRACHCPTFCGQQSSNEQNKTFALVS